MKSDILQILQEEATTQYNPNGKDDRVINSDEFDTVANQIINLYADKKYTEEDLHNLLRARRQLYSHTDENVLKVFINSLNKQD